MDKLEYSSDNEKYIDPRKRSKQRVLITNMESATDCTGKRLGTCQLGDKTRCYAECAEIQYPDVLPYRRRQEQQWERYDAAWFIAEIAGIQHRARRKYTHYRLNEAGEMKDRACMIKAANIAKSNEFSGIKTFIYTSRQDLWEECRDEVTQYSPMVVNGSGFMAHNCYKVVPEGYKAKKGEYWCPDKCYNCRMCKERLGVVILAKERHTKKAK